MINDCRSLSEHPTHLSGLRPQDLHQSLLISDAENVYGNKIPQASYPGALQWHLKLVGQFIDTCPDGVPVAIHLFRTFV